MTELGTIGKIIITDNIKKQIDYYHKNLNGVEWSGILFYNHTGGDIHKLKNLEFTATNFFLMDIGSHTYTNFETSADVIDAFELIGDSELSSLQGFLHSHHNMEAFFSGTDTKELVDNAPNYGFYVSLVVNTRDTYVCKVIFPTTTEVDTVKEFTVRDANGVSKKVKTKTKQTVQELLSGDLDIVFETSLVVDKWVVDRITKVRETKETAKKNKFESIGNFFLPNKYKNKPYYGGWDDFSTGKEAKSTVGKRNLLEQFAVGILTVDAESELTLGEALEGLLSLPKEDFEDFLKEVPYFIGDLHIEVFGNSFNFNEHVKQVSGLISATRNNYKVKLIINALDLIKEIDYAGNR